MEYSGFRGIIIKDDGLVLMERRKEDKHYFVLPGGHLEADESFEECIKREVKEEFGIVVEPQKLIYNLIAGENLQGVFVCKYIEGNIGKTADGEEYQENRNSGDYNPILLPLSQILETNIVPLELKEQLALDLQEYGNSLDRDLIDLVLQKR